MPKSFSQIDPKTLGNIVAECQDLLRIEYEAINRDSTHLEVPVSNGDSNNKERKRKRRKQQSGVDTTDVDKPLDPLDDPSASRSSLVPLRPSSSSKSNSKRRFNKQARMKDFHGKWAMPRGLTLRKHLHR